MKPGEGGESTGHTAPIYKALRRLADLGATITVIDHPRKDGDAIYGSMDKIAKSDTIHELDKIEVDSKNAIVSVASNLKRYAIESAGGFSFKVIGDDTHVRSLERVGDPKAEEHRMKMQTLLEIIFRDPNLSQKDITTLAIEKGIARDLTIKLLMEGVGKYWISKRGKHGRYCYKGIIARVP